MDLGRFGNVDVGGILRANSGLAYSLRSSGVSANATQRALLTRLGYPDRPSSWTIYYSQGRGSETFDGYEVFNVFGTYTPRGYDNIEVRLDVRNVFNETYSNRSSDGIDFARVVPLTEPGRTIALTVSTKF